MDGSGNTVLGGPFTHKQAGANAFDAYKVKQSDITMRLCKTPASSGWTYADLEDEDYVNAFTVGQKISAVLALSGKPEKTDDSILTTIVVYDENNNLISYTHSTIAWQTLWYQNYCEMDLTTIPAEAGTYNVIIYFNGSEVGSQKFEITA